MKKSESIAKLAAALSAAQAEIQPAPFDRENPYFKSRYATLASVFDAAKPAFRAGLSVTQTIEVQEGRVIVGTLLMHTSGEWIETEISLKPKSDGPQDVGSAGTYGRRYALAAILGVCSDEDDDGNIASGKTTPPATKKPEEKKPQQKPSTPPPVPASESKSSEPNKINTQKPEAQPDAPKRESAETAQPEPPKAPLVGAGTVAAEINRIRALAAQLKCKSAADVCALASGLVGREVKSSTDLSAGERQVVIDGMVAMIAESEVAQNG